MEWPQNFDALRAKAEQRLGKRIEQLNRAARRRLLEAIDQFGSVEAIPQAVWDDIEREAFFLYLPVFEWAAASAALIVLDSHGQAMPPELVASAVAQRSREMAQVVATDTADGIRKGVQRRFLKAIELAALPTAAVAADASPAAMSRAAIKSATEFEAETDGAARLERAAGNDVTALISNGVLEAAAIIQTANPHQVVTIRWRVRKVTGDNRPGALPDEKVCPICGPQEGLEMDVWARYLSAPPAHFNCRCELQVFVSVVLPGLLSIQSQQVGRFNPPGWPRF